MTTVPGFFIHGASAGIRFLSAVIVLATVVTVVLILRRERASATMTD